MGANAQTTVPTFTAGEVLTAAQQNASARTGVPVFATTGTRDAGFGGTGEKTLAEGQLCYVEGTGLQSYNGTSWVTWGTAPSSGALVRIGGATMSASSSTTISSAFSSTYRSYLIVIDGLFGSVNGNDLRLRMGTTSSGNYWYGVNRLTFSGSASPEASTAQTSAYITAFRDSLDYATGVNLWVHNPNLAAYTTMNWMSTYNGATAGAAYNIQGAAFVNLTTAYTSFELFSSSGTITGTVNVYGLAIS